MITPLQGPSLPSPAHTKPRLAQPSAPSLAQPGPTWPGLALERRSSQHTAYARFPTADAKGDSVPMVCFSGQVPTAAVGTDAFQECASVKITEPCKPEILTVVPGTLESNPNLRLPPPRSARAHFRPPAQTPASTERRHCSRVLPLGLGGRQDRAPGSSFRQSASLPPLLLPGPRHGVGPVACAESVPSLR